MLNTLGWAHSEIGCHAVAAELNRAGTDLAREAVELGLVAGAPELYANAPEPLAQSSRPRPHRRGRGRAIAPINGSTRPTPIRGCAGSWSTHLLHPAFVSRPGTGHADEALALARQEAGAASRPRRASWIGRAHEQLGRILLLTDARDEAETELRTALTLAQGIEHPTWCGAHAACSPSSPGGTATATRPADRRPACGTPSMPSAHGFQAPISKGRSASWDSAPSRPDHGG